MPKTKDAFAFFEWQWCVRILLKKVNEEIPFPQNSEETPFLNWRVINLIASDLNEKIFLDAVLSGNHPIIFLDEANKYFFEETIIERFLRRSIRIARDIERHINRLNKLCIAQLTKVAYGDAYEYENHWVLKKTQERIAECEELLIDIRNVYQQGRERLHVVKQLSRKNFNLKFGERLKEARKGKGLSARSVAEIIGISPSAYSNYEGGIREPPLLLVVKLANIFDVAIDWLLGRTQYPHVY